MKSIPSWHIPVRLEEVTPAGLTVKAKAADELRAGLAERAGLRSLPRLEVLASCSLEGRGLRATGRVSATVGQTCVVTLEPIESEIDEAFDVLFVPTADEQAAEDSDEDGLTAAEVDPNAEPPEPLVDGVADIGSVASDFLMLAIDPYPRKAGAVFAPTAQPADKDAASPFAIFWLA